LAGSSSKETILGKRLYVGNLSYSVTETDLREAFGAEGLEVVEVKIVMDRDTGRPRGFAFVEMATDEGAAQAIQNLNGRELMGRAVNVSEARERTGGGGGRGGFGGGGGFRGGGGGGGYGGGGGGYGGGGGGYGGGGGGGGDGGRDRGRRGGRRERW
jgi:RNA recognition motif-containing protein